MDESPIDVNSQSRALNYLFSLSAIGVSEHFTTYNSMIDVPTFHPFTETRHHDIFLGGGPYWLAMQGRMLLAEIFVQRQIKKFMRLQSSC